MKAVIATARNPEGRIVQMEIGTWNHVVDEHAELADSLGEVMGSIETPVHREPDPRVGRERYFGYGGPQGWLRVVTEFAGAMDRVITAFPQCNDPRQG